MSILNHKGVKHWELFTGLVSERGIFTPVQWTDSLQTVSWLIKQKQLGWNNKALIIPLRCLLTTGRRKEKQNRNLFVLYYAPDYVVPDSIPSKILSSNYCHYVINSFSRGWENVVPEVWEIIPQRHHLSPGLSRAPHGPSLPPGFGTWGRVS